MKAWSVGLLFALTGCGVAPADHTVLDQPDNNVDALIGGTELDPLHHEFVGAVRVNWRHGYSVSLCTGNYITPTWVLTAGHCVEPGAPPNQVTATMGSQVVGVRSFLHHPQYDYDGSVNRTSHDTCKFDALLLELDSPLEIHELCRMEAVMSVCITEA